MKPAEERVMALRPAGQEMATRGHRIEAVEDAFLRFLGVADPQARRALVEQILLEEMRGAASGRGSRRAPKRRRAAGGPQVLTLSPDPDRYGLVVARAAPRDRG